MIYIAVLEGSNDADDAPLSDTSGALISVESGVACLPNRPESFSFVEPEEWPDTARVSVRTQDRQVVSQETDRRCKSDLGQTTRER